MTSGKVAAEASGMRIHIMGVLNVTPDSFSDGGAFADADCAAACAGEMLAHGAEVIDIGPESMRPGAAPVPGSEQIRRALPVVERIRRAHPEAVLSLDTRSFAVARAGLEAGVAIINDISALCDAPELGRLIADHGAGVVLMHMRGEPATMQQDPQYADVVQEVAEFLRERAAFAESQGISRSRIMIDPGIGFGKTAAHNLAILAGLERLVALGYPVLLGASRKSFIARVSAGGEAPDQRLGGSLACVARALAAGVHMVRVHDVRATRQFLDVLAAMAAARQPA